MALECEARGAASARVAACDIRDAEALQRVLDSVADEEGSLGAVVHSAAVLSYGRFTEVPAHVFDAAVSTTLLGAANVARSSLVVFARQGHRGSFVVVGSLLGKVITPFLSSYTVPKFGVQALVRTLQVEYRRSRGLCISMVSPGSVNTPTYDLAGTYLGFHGRPPPPIQQPEAIAEHVVSAITRPRRDRNTTVANFLVIFGFRTLPGLYDVLVGPLARLLAVSRRRAPIGPGNVFAPPPGEAVRGRWPRPFS